VQALITSFFAVGCVQVKEALVAARTHVAELEALLKIKHEQAARDQVCERESWMLYFE
jgi:hypothetical protein